MSTLNYKTIGGDILVFKGKDTLTIHRGNDGEPYPYDLEIDGERVDLLEDEFVNPFTYEEMKYFVDNYEKIVGPNY